MYGMIHRALRGMVIEQAGEAAWDEIERGLGFGPAQQISAQIYDDAVTLAMVGAAAERMKLPVAELLGRFGRHWIGFAERGSYGAIMDFTGRDLASFIGNLDRMHQAVLAALPEARVPSFELVDATPGRLRVRYRSEREGLEPFVAGLLEGLLDRFGLTGEVSRVHGAVNDAAEFLVTHE
ncbi:MAG: heme NO-binding domain-containing protein [Sphingomonadales bacterium]|nr:heme NO-binding domain-containing protein [Sphingomonadales bacterium]